MSKVLIVDDEKDICEIVKEYVVEIVPSAQVATVHDGLDGFLACSKEPYDLVITDMKMPFLNGKDFILAMRTKENKNNATPVIMLSGFLNAETISRLEEKGIICLSKPINSEAFTQAVKKALNI